MRAQSDEAYIIDLCDKALGYSARRGHRFPFLVGDKGHQLPVDAYYEELQLVVEYRERQHTESIAMFDKRTTVSGVPRGKQRALYDQRRRDELPKHGITLVEFDYGEFPHNSKKRLKRTPQDFEIVRKKLERARGAGHGKAPGRSRGAKSGLTTLSTAQIGRSGELFVQFRLLLLGVESAPMSTDVGVDLVAYSPFLNLPLTIQVKTNLRAKPGGGKGKQALDWWIAADSPAQYVALVDLSTERVWFFSKADLVSHAQQQSSGRLHIYMYTDPSARPRRTDKPAHVYEFERYLLSNCAHRVFGVR